MNRSPSKYTFRTLLIFPLLCLIQLSGCASVAGPTDERDPFESFNRAMYTFNDTVDKAILKPVAETYEENVPQPVQTGVSNFFSNLDDILVLLNDLLQFKFEQAASDFSRIVWNSTVGLFGLIDVASEMDLPKHNEDFGQTLATWGVGDGPYLVLPFIGPSTLRDTGGLVVDYTYDPLNEIEDDEAYWAAFTLRVIDKRVELLSASRVLEEAALDPYIFMRDAYLQHRRNLIHDGNPPQEKIDLGDPDEDADLELELELELEDKKQNNPAAN